MKSTSMLTILFGVAAAYGQAPPAAQRTGPGVQAPQDAKYQDLIKACKVPPPPAPGRGGGAKGGPAKGQAKGPAPAEAGPKDVTIMAIPGVIAAGQQWKEVWKVEGNNADGIVATKDGGLLLAQNDNSNVVKLDKNGKVSNAYTGLNTSGSVAMNGKYLFVLNRGLNQSIEQLEPQRKTLANKTTNGDPMDCLGSLLNDMTADSKGGVYFTMGSVYHADAKGTITKYGQNINGNGIVLSPDEKHLFVTNGAALAEFDVQKDGSLMNQREFAKLEGGGDGSTFDSAGRLYVTLQGAGIQVFSPDGKSLGVIPTPRPVITVTFSGADRKMLYAVSRTGNTDWIIGIPMIAQGPKGRGK